MQYKQLGNTSVKIPAIGMGTMGIGGYFTRDDSRDDHFVGVLERGIDAGMTFIDTAEAYAKGHSEELVGRAIKGKRKNIIVSSKVSPQNLQRDDVIKAAEESLLRLQTDYIDLYQVHWPNPRIPIGETMEAMERLVSSGKIRYIGVSNYSLHELKEALTCFGDIVSLQVEYNLFDRTIEEDILPFCNKNKISVLAYTPLCSGQITFNVFLLPLLSDIAAKYSKRPAQIALRWLTTNNSVIAIPKASGIDHVQINSEATDFDLTEEDYNSLSDLCKERCKDIPTDRILVDRNGLDKLVPSVEDLAGLIKRGVPIKPIGVIKSEDPLYDYKLVEGKLRFWAWAMAHNGNLPISALIRQ